MPSSVQSQDGPRFPVLSEAAEVGTGALAPCFDGAPGVVECGRFRVLEDRTKGSGRTLDLAFVVARALDEEKRQRDAVTFLFGGPGSSVVAQAKGTIGLFKGVREQRDLLLLDFRGVGFSDELACDVPYPSGVASRFESVLPEDHIRACRKELSKRAKLDQYNSVSSMDDLNELRAFLGYDGLNFYAGSYGTKEVQVYLRQHPESARVAILDGVSPIFHKSYLSHARGLQNALDLVVKECGADDQCNGAYPSLRTEIAQVLERAKRKPAKVLVEGEEFEFGVAALGYALRGLLYRQGAQVPFYIHTAAKGNWQPLADYYLGRQSWVGKKGGDAGYHFSAICAENIAFITDEEVKAETANTFLGSTLIDAYRSMCRAWPHARLDKSFLDPVRSPVPTLIFSGERDPVTPPSNGEALARYLENSAHVIVRNGGHGTFGPCYQAMVRHVVETGSTEGIDLTCIGESESTDFRLP